MKTRAVENLVLLVGATGLIVMGARLVRLVAFTAYGLGRLVRREKVAGTVRQD